MCDDRSPGLLGVQRILEGFDRAAVLHLAAIRAGRFALRELLGVGVIVGHDQSSLTAAGSLVEPEMMAWPITLPLLAGS